MILRIAIIGGGWYGCHIGTTLLDLGMDVTLFERHSDLLREASGNNQFRLHLGFHYPRHEPTRAQSRDGFARFIRQYGAFSREVPNNIYAVPTSGSLMDLATYRAVMASSTVPFADIEIPIILTGVEGCIRVDERAVLTDVARRWFTAKLGSRAAINQKVTSVHGRANHVMVEGERFDFAVDATWGHRLAAGDGIYYEPTILLYYQASATFPAITLVDGPFCSIYPTEWPAIFTLSSVPHAPLGRFDASAGAHKALRRVNTDLVIARRAAMEAQISRYVPSFLDIFQYLGPQFAIKTKPTNAADDRSCTVRRDGRILSVMSGKIDTIFHAADRVIELMKVEK